jgi:hypothetical protein
LEEVSQAAKCSPDFQTSSFKTHLAKEANKVPIQVKETELSKASTISSIQGQLELKNTQIENALHHIILWLVRLTAITILSHLNLLNSEILALHMTVRKEFSKRTLFLHA